MVAFDNLLAIIRITKIFSCAKFKDFYVPLSWNVIIALCFVSFTSFELAEVKCSQHRCYLEYEGNRYIYARLSILFSLSEENHNTRQVFCNVIYDPYGALCYTTELSRNTINTIFFLSTHTTAFFHVRNASQCVLRLLCIFLNWTDCSNILRI